jgi:hypothetical protein
MIMHWQHVVPVQCITLRFLSCVCAVFSQHVPGVVIASPHATLPSILALVHPPVLQTFGAMDAQQILPRVPNVKFRVLIIGRANAGKTSVLQRVCETTESPVIYSVNSSGVREQVRSRSQWLL